MFKVITMTDSKYFNVGKQFIKTRKLIDADFICYSPDLTEEQFKILDDNNIQVKYVSKNVFDTRMQSLKYEFLLKETNDIAIEGLTFCDFDTYFLSEWSHIFKDKFDIGITYRQEMIDKKCLRAMANGGVIFTQNNSGSVKLLKFALKCIENYGDGQIPEYDNIWQTLEKGRRENKTHLRTNLRWWVDQVFLSALIMNNTGFNVKLFDCKQYNNMYNQSEGHIIHLKNNSSATSSQKDGK